MKMTDDELKRLAELNAEREPLQEKLLEAAERVFQIWSKVNPTKPSLARYFQTATVSNDSVIVEYEESCCCISNEYTKTFSLEMLTGSEEQP